MLNPIFIILLKIHFSDLNRKFIMLKFVDYYLQRRIEAPFQKVGEQQFYED